MGVRTHGSHVAAIAILPLRNSGLRAQNGARLDSRFLSVFLPGAAIGNYASFLRWPKTMDWIASADDVDVIVCFAQSLAATWLDTRSGEVLHSCSRRRLPTAAIFCWTFLFKTYDALPIRSKKCHFSYNCTLLTGVSTISSLRNTGLRSVLVSSTLHRVSLL